MYLVSLESFFKMQENGVCFMLEYSVHMLKSDHVPKGAHPPFEKSWIRHCYNILLDGMKGNLGVKQVAG